MMLESRKGRVMRSKADRDGRERFRARLITFVLSGAAALVSVTAVTDALGDDKPICVNEEGLVRVSIEGIQQVYARPGAKLSGYTKIMLDPISVSFRRDWDPRPGGQAVSASEKQAIRDGLARELREAFTEELERSGHYQVVAAPATDVLRIQADVRDLYINAPDVPRAADIHTYTVSVGEMTLVAEIRDAPSGDLIARIVDHRRDPDSPWLELTTRVENVAAAQRAAARWARILREQLDAANRGIG